MASHTPDTFAAFRSTPSGFQGPSELHSVDNSATTIISAVAPPPHANTAVVPCSPGYFDNTSQSQYSDLSQVRLDDDSNSDANLGTNFATDGMQSRDIQPDPRSAPTHNPRQLDESTPSTAHEPPSSETSCTEQSAMLVHPEKVPAAETDHAVERPLDTSSGAETTQDGTAETQQDASIAPAEEEGEMPEGIQAHGASGFKCTVCGIDLDDNDAMLAHVSAPVHRLMLESKKDQAAMNEVSSEDDRAATLSQVDYDQCLPSEDRPPLVDAPDASSVEDEFGATTTSTTAEGGTNGVQEDEQPGNSQASSSPDEEQNNAHPATPNTEYCELCNCAVTCLRDHLEKGRHLDALRRLEDQGPMGSRGLYCSACGLMFENLNALLEHFESDDMAVDQTHERWKPQDAAGRLLCSPCDETFVEHDFVKHLRSRIHEYQVKGESGGRLSWFSDAPSVGVGGNDATDEASIGSCPEPQTGRKEDTSQTKQRKNGKSRTSSKGARKKPPKCYYCKLDFRTMEEYAAHVVTYTHLDRVNAYNGSERVNPRHVRENDKLGLDRTSHFCPQCELHFAGDHQFQEHLSSRSHRQRGRTGQAASSAPRLEDWASFGDDSSGFTSNFASAGIRSIECRQEVVKSSSPVDVEQEVRQRLLSGDSGSRGPSFAEDQELFGYGDPGRDEFSNLNLSFLPGAAGVPSVASAVVSTTSPRLAESRQSTGPTHGVNVDLRPPSERVTPSQPKDDDMPWMGVPTAHSDGCCDYARMVGRLSCDDDFIEDTAFAAKRDAGVARDKPVPPVVGQEKLSSPPADDLIRDHVVDQMMDLIQTMVVRERHLATRLNQADERERQLRGQVDEMSDEIARLRGILNK